MLLDIIKQLHVYKQQNSGEHKPVSSRDLTSAACIQTHLALWNRLACRNTLIITNSELTEQIRRWKANTVHN